MNKLTYIRCGDYDIPNRNLPEQPETSTGKYGRMRTSYLKEHRPILYNQLLMSEKLYPHLLEICLLYTSTHEAIIDQQTFDLVQKIRHDENPLPSCQPSGACPILGVHEPPAHIRRCLLYTSTLSPNLQQ